MSTSKHVWKEGVVLTSYMETAEIQEFIDNGAINILAICVLIAIKLRKNVVKIDTAKID